MESASFSWEGAWPTVTNASQNACSQMASVNVNEMKPIVRDTTDIVGREAPEAIECAVAVRWKGRG